MLFARFWPSSVASGFVGALGPAPAAHLHVSWAGMRRHETVDTVMGAWGLIVAAWLAALAPVPWFFYTLAGYLMAAGSGHASLGEVMALGAGPIVALGALFADLLWCQRSGKRIAAMMLPGLLVLIELTFLVVVLVGK